MPPTAPASPLPRSAAQLSRAAALLATAAALVACGREPAPWVPPGRLDGGPPRDVGPPPWRIDSSCGLGLARDAGLTVGRADADVDRCVALTAETPPPPAPMPVDVIVVVDNSGSMSAEAALVRENLHRFTETLASSALDYRLVVVSATRTATARICVPPPLGTGEPDCGSAQPDRFLPVHAVVGSRNAFEVVLRQHDAFRDFLRERSLKVFVWVTDDNSAMQADEFVAALSSLEPPGIYDLTMHHAIVGFHHEHDWHDDEDSECPTLARVGSIYLRLTQCRCDDLDGRARCLRGARASICEADWTPIFDAMARAIAQSAAVVCEIPIPRPEGAVYVAPETIRVRRRTADGATHDLTRIDDPTACGPDRFLVSRSASGDVVQLCGETCDALATDGDVLDIDADCRALE
jgi:hypothetical protein